MSEHSLIYHDAVPRATPLSPDERRRALVDATLPLLRTHGAGVSTRQIAEAAGVAEGTIFRAVPSKDDLINEAVAEALDPGRLVERLRRAASDPDLEASVTGVVGVLQEHSRDTRLLFTIAQQPGTACRDPHATPRQVKAALADLLAPFADRLTLDPASAAGVIMGLSFGSALAALTGGPTPSPAQVAGVLLHGIAKEI